MSYTINKYSGEELVVLQDGTIDTSTSLGLVGRNYVGYGETQNENFVFLLENFSNEFPPARPLKGQTWFNTLSNLLYVYDGAAWAVVGAAVLSETRPEEPASGALWLRTTDNTFHVWNGAQWSFIGPESVEGFGITRARSTTLLDSDGTTHPVIFLTIDDSIVGICTNSTFTISPQTPILGFANLLAGVNLSTNFKFKGDIDGLAERATRLETPRNINGVAFNGSNNITVKASTTNKLTKGDYLTGSDFDGSIATTWSVDATSANTIGKIVVRNSSGGFAAGLITADLAGNVSGNVTAETGTSSFNIIRANTFIGPTLVGNAESASRLETTRTINDVPFDGTANITIPSAAETLTGTRINSTVVESNLQSVGVLNELLVSNSGIRIGSGSQFRLIVDSAIPTVRSTTGILNFDMGSSGPDVSFINSAKSLELGGPNAPAIIGDNTTNLGINGYKFNNIYANNLLGNASTATQATTALNLSGGGAGSIPYQTAIGATAMLPLAPAGYILKSAGGNTITWSAPTFEGLAVGDYLALKNTSTNAPLSEYTTVVPTTISVDATPNNTANKVVARNASGNFSAGTITANLAGNATTATTANYANTAGNANTANYAGTAGSATSASYSVTQANNNNSTLIATTQYVDRMVGLLNPRSMVLTSASLDLGNVNPIYPRLINAHTPASSAPGQLFYLTINIIYAGTSTSVSGGRWINAYQWGTLSVGASTTLYNNSLGYKLTYYSDGANWYYTGQWSYV